MFVSGEGRFQVQDCIAGSVWCCEGNQGLGFGGLGFRVEGGSGLGTFFTTSNTPYPTIDTINPL